MARPAAIIQKQILDYALANYGTNQGDPFYYIFHDKNNNAITPSKVNLFVLISFIVATSINIFEQLLDVFKSTIEKEIAQAAPGTNAWLQQQVLNFQYSATDPQVIQFVTNDAGLLYPQYPVVNPALRIITQCAVVTRGIGGYVIKVASNLLPVGTTEMNALTSYCQQINFGVPFSFINVNADMLYFGADIYYNGQYSPVIKDNVKAAITAYINDFDTNNFNGTIFLSKLEDVIQAVAGVSDVVLKQIEVNPDPALLLPTTVMVNNYNEALRYYNTYAGYMIVDTNTGRTLDDTLNFFIQ